MDYSSPFHQMYTMLHFAFSFWLLFVLWPKFFLRGGREDRLEEWLAFFVKATCLYIILGYLLVLLKLYEVISIAAVLLLASTRKLWMKGSESARKEAGNRFNVWFYELLEVGFRLRTRWEKLRGRLTMARKQIRLKDQRNDVITPLLLCILLAVSAYLRFYDAVHYAAPALSDGAVTLAWMKYINARILFHDGIYPQGFHIILSMLSKFAGIDPLYILKYTGPFVGVLAVFIYYFALSRLTGSRTAGLIGAAVYGLGGELLFGMDWERQAATNSQEFAFVLVVPSLYFVLNYLKRGNQDDLWSGAAALTVAGLVHSLAFAFAGLGVGAALIASMLTPSTRSWHRIGIVCLAAIGTVVISMAPILIAAWTGVPYNESAANFLTNTTEISFPNLLLKDYIALGSVAIIAFTGLIGWKDSRMRLEEWFAVGWGTASFLLFYAVPALTGSTMLAARSESLWTLAVCFCIGFAWHSVWRLAGSFKRRLPLETAVSTVAIVSIVLYVQPSPIVTYKMDWESVFRQYLRIASEHAAKTWTIFSQEEGYSLAYGAGWHQYIRTLVTEYDPRGTPITRNDQSEYDPDVTPVMYVFEEKEIYRVPAHLSIYSILQERYRKHEEDQVLLKDWLEEYSLVHGKPPIYYEDEHIRIWYLERPEASDKTQRRLWGTPS